MVCKHAGMYINIFPHNNVYFVTKLLIARVLERNSIIHKFVYTSTFNEYENVIRTE